MENKSEKELKRARRLGWLGYTLARFLGRTARVYKENVGIIEMHRQSGTGAVLVAWHGRTLIPANMLRGLGCYALVSHSRDGEIQANIFSRFGFKILRGSTGRGGVRAALEAARAIKQGEILAFTPDGPRGPSRKVQPGALMIAQKSGCPLYPIGTSAYPRKLLPTWDQYLIPFPFARAAFLIGEPIYIPAEVDKDDYAEFAEQVECAINELEARAETIVRGGHR
jgi:lysophospholipid acyltransferase (LPLAT)-like uncharacterized protein